MVERIESSRLACDGRDHKPVTSGVVLVEESRRDSVLEKIAMIFIAGHLVLLSVAPSARGNLISENPAAATGDGILMVSLQLPDPEICPLKSAEITVTNEL